jgi:hypothetical protein
MIFTRETVLSAVVLVFASLGLYLIVLSMLGKSREAKVRTATAIAGVAILSTIIATRPSTAWDLARFRIEDVSGILAVAVIVGSIVAGVALGDYAFSRIVPGIASWPLWGRRDDDIAEGSMVLVLGLLFAGLGFVSVQTIDPNVQAKVGESGLQTEVAAEFALPDEPRDLVFTGVNTGFISFPNSIAHFTVTESTNGLTLELEEAVGSNEISNPRGLAINDQYLFVAEQGEPEEDAPTGMFSTNGEVVRFTIGGDQALSNRTVIVDQVPVANVLHGINGMAVSDDGQIYLSIGGTKNPFSPSPPNEEWLGTIIRFDPDGNDLEVFAQGLRNVYDLEFDQQGRLWGVDNDGPTVRDYRAEEIIQIKEGEHYGYPVEGTFGNHVRTDEPVWAYTGHDVEGSAGIELTERLGLQSGLLIGSRTLIFFEYGEDENGIYASTDVDVQGNPTVFERQGYFTIVEASDSGLLYVGVAGLSLQDNLYLLRLSD